MPKTKTSLPPNNTSVRFRVHSSPNLLHGVYTTAAGFEACSGFICYSVAEVYYWQPEMDGAK